MKIAVSNIAWNAEDDDVVARELVQQGVTAIELAPTKKWDDPTVVSESEARRYSGEWRERGLEVVAFQSLLYARPDLALFGSASSRNDMTDYLKRFIRLAGWMGARRLVFGSPKNRQKGDMPVETADEIASRFFDRLGTEASNNGVVLCIEPNAPQYACDYITNASEGTTLVRRINNPGFRLHLDTGCMALAREDVSESIERSFDVLSHFHASSPMLETVMHRNDVDHLAAARSLMKSRYDGYISIEMKPSDDDLINRIDAAVDYVRKVYA